MCLKFQCSTFSSLKIQKHFQKIQNTQKDKESSKTFVIPILSLIKVSQISPKMICIWCSIAVHTQFSLEECEFTEVEVSEIFKTSIYLEDDSYLKRSKSSLICKTNWNIKLNGNESFTGIRFRFFLTLEMIKRAPIK